MKKLAETRRKIRTKTIMVKKHFIREGKIVETIVAVAATIKTNAADIKTNAAENIKTNVAAATADMIKITEISQNLKETATIVEFTVIKRLNVGKRNEIMAAAITAAEIAEITAVETKEIMV